MSHSHAQQAVTTYLDRVEKDLKAGQATEHTHRAALTQLFNALMPGTDATNEPKRGKYGAPDYLITRHKEGVSLTLGYAEAKDVGVSLSETEKTEQLARYRAALPNLLLTDYLEFRWYKGGERQPQHVTLAEWDSKGKKLGRVAGAPQQLADLLALFAGQEPEPIARAKDLAGRMAHLTQLIRTIALDVLHKGEASAILGDLLKSFRQTILPELTEEDFADMYAQTLAYGLFAARVNHAATAAAAPFSRRDAAHYIPKTNPLLQKLFYTLTGPDLNEEPYVGLVDDLAQVLRYAEMSEILAEFGTSVREEDPIVHFYETFLAQYNPRLREQRGVYYTPAPVVDYIVRSVDALLKADFGLGDGLGDTEKAEFVTSDEQGQPKTITAPRLLIADPATGTGTFPYQIIKLLRERFYASGNAGQWPHYVRDHLLHALYGFELMMAPYAIAHLKLSMELGGLDMPHHTPDEQQQRAKLSVPLEQRLNIYLTNSIDDPKHEIMTLSGPFKVISDEAQLAGKIKADYPIVVVLGNPPYSGHSANKNGWIDDLLKGIRRDSEGKPIKGRHYPASLSSYYEVDGAPLGERNPKWLQDDYVKFIRWAQWRVHTTGAGIVAFITPHGYLDNPTFRGMRQSLSRTFDEIYVLDLHGNTNKKEKAPDGSPDENVFDIRTGVAIGLFVRRPGAEGARAAKIYRADLWGKREGKYKWLLEQDVKSGGYKELTPAAPMYLWADQNETIREEYEQGWRLSEISNSFSPAIATARDSFVIGFERAKTEERMKDFIGLAQEEAREKYELGKDTRDWQIKLAQEDLSSLDNIKASEYNYRPFDARFAVYTGITRGIMCMPRGKSSENMLKPNVAILANKAVEDFSNGFHHIFLTDKITDLHSLSLKEANYFFPLYLYPAPDQQFLHAYDFPIDAKGRTPNLSKGFVAALSQATGLQFSPDGSQTGTGYFSPEDVFHYIYAVLHSPSYRTRYADFLRTDFPRIPLPDSAERFAALAGLGGQLAGLHLLRTAGKVGGFPETGSGEVAKGYPKYAPPAEGDTAGRVLINAGQWFTGVTPETWAFRVGGYQVAEKWLKDRRGRVLNFDDITHYQRILGALGETQRLMQEVDAAAAGLWPSNNEAAETE